MLLKKLLDTHRAKILPRRERGDAPYETEHFAHITDLEEFLKQAKQRFELDWKAKPVPHGDITDYQLYQVIARGRYNTIVLAKHKDATNKCVLKVFDKYQLINADLVDRVYNEMKVMLVARFPFIMNLGCIMQDKHSLYLSMPYIECGDLYLHIKKLGCLEEPHARFYAAQLILALEYLHYVKVVHRDVKPENVLLDFLGNLKICDMGLSRIVNSRTYSFCGTPEYIAPEIIQLQPYGASVDWWAFGVLLYEMCYGLTPFKNKDNLVMYSNIVLGKYHLPPFLSNELKDLLTNLLQVDVSKRYGCLKNGVKDLKEHPWFETVDWMMCANRQVPTPYAPYCVGPTKLKAYTVPSQAEDHALSREDFDYLFENF